MAELFGLGNVHVIVDADHLFKRTCRFRLEIGAIPMFFKLGGAAVYVDGFQIFRFQLVPDK